MTTYELLRSQTPLLYPQDVPAINHLLKQLTPGAREVSMRDMHIAAFASNIFIAFMGEGRTRNIIGMATLVACVTPTGGKGFVEDVVVDEAYRGQGIARELMQRIITKAKELHLDKLNLTSRSSREAANRLYLRLGFTRYETNVYTLALRGDLRRDEGF